MIIVMAVVRSNVSMDAAAVAILTAPVRAVEDVWVSVMADAQILVQVIVQLKMPQMHMMYTTKPDLDDLYKLELK